MGRKRRAFTAPFKAKVALDAVRGLKTASNQHYKTTTAAKSGKQARFRAPSPHHRTCGFA